MAGAGGRPRRRSPDEARVIERFKRLAPQLQALTLALQKFSDESGQVDRSAWAEAFSQTTADPQTIVNVKAVTGLYEGLVNHLVEMMQSAARARGLAVVKGEVRPNGPELFAAVHDDGGITSSQVDVLRRLYQMRNQLQHASPGVDAAQVLDDIELLQKTLARFVKSYVLWLERHGITLMQ